ncbi:MAG TPA: Cd(II)/Pb(II)-responsive transcriptional regulator [Steroidobacteraceae bacterium]|nr:Cd(II)/Pb(II)-responsive transcriptional regulator [Steroidobacteraceae bacterium]
MTIGALAQRLQCQTETIRFYEREGLLPPPARSGGNYRLYGAAQLERLGFIRRCRSLDMTLDEIRVLLQLRDKPAQNCREVNTVLDEHIQHVTERIAQLRTLQRQLRDLQQWCAKEPDGCGILKELARDTQAAQPPAVSRHIRGSHLHRAVR